MKDAIAINTVAAPTAFIIPKKLHFPSSSFLTLIKPMYTKIISNQLIISLPNKLTILVNAIKNPTIITTVNKIYGKFERVSFLFISIKKP